MCDSVQVIQIYSDVVKLTKASMALYTLMDINFINKFDIFFIVFMTTSY